MKNLILKFGLCICFVLLGFGSKAQNVYTINTSSPTSCDGVATVLDSVAFTGYTWYVGSSVISSQSETMYGLCAGTYTVVCSGPGGTNTFDFVILSGNVQDPCADFFVYTNLTTTPTLGACDGVVTASVIGGVAPYSYLWNGISPSSTLTNVCSNTSNYISVTDGNGCVDSTIFYVSGDSVPNSGCNGFEASISVLNPVSSPSTCDGVLMASASGGFAPYTYTWSTGSTTMEVGNLCTGYYTLTAVDSIGCSASISLYLIGDTTIVIDSSFVLNTYSMMVSADGACDGWVTITPSLSNGNYTYVLSNGLISSTGYFDSLCAGIYSVYVYNSFGDTVTNDFIISTPSNNYTTSNFIDSTIVDSLMGSLQAFCNFNFGGIDSVYITGYTINGDSILVNWLVINGSTISTTFTETYFFAGVSGIYQFGLMVYCPGKSLGNYFTAHDQIAVSTSLGISDQDLTNILMYPNPATEFVTIQFPSLDEYQITITDLTGRTLKKITVINQSAIDLKLNDLDSGKYLVTISSNEFTILKSLLK